MRSFAQIFVLIFFHQFLYSQTVERFHFSLPETKISNSKYSSFEFIDSRSDTSNFGRIYSNHYKRKVPLIADVDMKTQLNWLLHHALDTSAGKGELLFQLRKLQLVEVGGEIPDYGYCALRAELFVKKGSDYFFLTELDTFLSTPQGIGRINVTDLLVKYTKETLTNFVLKNLELEASSEKFYTAAQITKIDSIEKSILPLYQSQNYTKGVYLSYESFKKQSPDYKLFKVHRKFDEINALTIIDNKGKQLKISYKEVYGFVFSDTAYISDNYGCYALQKKDNDFYFIGKGKTLAKGESVTLAGAIGFVAGGPIGGVAAEQISKNSAYAFFKAKLDHCDGSVIWFEKIN